MPLAHQVSFSEEQIRVIEQKYNVLVIPCLNEQFVEELFLANLEKIGFDRVTHDRDCFERIWKRIGKCVDFKGVDYIGWKGNEPYTVELETWASFARFHDYQGYLDFIVCLQKDNWSGSYGDTQVIELWKIVGVKEILTRTEIGCFLYEKDQKFREWFNKKLSISYEQKMGIT